MQLARRRLPRARSHCHGRPRKAVPGHGAPRQCPCCWPWMQPPLPGCLPHAPEPPRFKFIRPCLHEDLGSHNNTKSSTAQERLPASQCRARPPAASGYSRSGGAKKDESSALFLLLGAARAVEVHAGPLGTLLLPDARLLALDCLRDPAPRNLGGGEGCLLDSLPSQLPQLPLF